MLRIPEAAELRSMAGTSERLSFGPVVMGSAWRYETLPSAPELVGFVATDPINRDLTPGPGDLLEIIFDAATDQAGRALGGNGLLGLESEAHELFYFYDRDNKRITEPLFLEYSSGWSDASTFTISVLNGTNYAEREDEGALGLGLG